MSDFINYLKTESFRKNIIAAVVTFFVLLLIAFFSLRYYTKHGEGLNVPSLKGMPVEEAINKLQSLGLRYEIDSVFVASQAPGVVTDQDPEMGTFVKDNRTIYLTINANQTPKVNFPDILEKSIKEAAAILDSYGLKVGDTTYKADIARDIALETSYAGRPLQAGDLLPKGSRINLVLGDGRGNEEVELPNLVGLTIDEAKFSLNGAMLNLGTINYQGVITDTANAIIVNQTPSPTDSLNKVSIGTKINITLKN
jgi:beta-lactam-binding protein with PASTA domain